MPPDFGIRDVLGVQLPKDRIDRNRGSLIDSPFHKPLIIIFPTANWLR
jgi:hypothetical protein